MVLWMGRGKIKLNQSEIKFEAQSWRWNKRWSQTKAEVTSYERASQEKKEEPIAGHQKGAATISRWWEAKNGDYWCIQYCISQDKEKWKEKDQPSTSQGTRQRMRIKTKQDTQFIHNHLNYPRFKISTFRIGRSVMMGLLSELDASTCWHGCTEQDSLENEQIRSKHRKYTKDAT